MQLRGASDLDQRGFTGSERVIPNEDVRYGCPLDVPFNFWSKTPKTEILRP